MKKPMVPVFGARVLAATAFALLAQPATSFAQDVQLNAYDGSTSMTGDLVAYHNGSYYLATVLGVIPVSSRYVRCSGDACPPLRHVMLDVSIAKKVTPVEVALPAGFAGDMSE